MSRLGGADLFPVPFNRDRQSLPGLLRGSVAGRPGPLYTDLPRRTLYLTAIPTGLVIPALLAGSAVVTIGESTYYGYMQGEFKLAAFVGTVMVYGSAAPELLER